MRRVATVVLVLLVVLAVGGTAVDRFLVARTEDRLLAEAREWADLAAGSAVEIDGFPFLTQVAAGRLSEVRGTAPALVAEGLELEDVRVAVRGVVPQEPYPAETVEVNAVIPASTLRTAVSGVVDLPGDLLLLDVVDGSLRLGIEVAGLELGVLLEPAVVDGAIGIRLGEVLVGDADLPGPAVGALEDLLGEVRLQIPGLPEGLAPTRVRVEGEGLAVRLEGSDVRLGEWIG